MSRFDQSRFEPKPHEDLVCAICLDVLDQPTITPCEHFFCHTCIWNVHPRQDGQVMCPNCRYVFSRSRLRESPKAVANIVNSLTMKCQYFEKGCANLIPVEEYFKHVETCAYKNDCTGYNAARAQGPTPKEKQKCSKCHLPLANEDATPHHCVTALLHKINEQSSAETKLRAAHSLRGKKVAEQQKNISILSTKCSQLKDMLCQMKKEKTEKESEGKKLRNEVLHREAEITELKKSIASLSAKWSEQERKLSEKMEEARETNLRFDRVLATFQCLKNTVSEMEKEKEVQAIAEQERRAKIFHLETRISEQRKHINSLSAKCSEQENTLSVQRSQMADSLSTKIGLLKEEKRITSELTWRLIAALDALSDSNQRVAKQRREIFHLRYLRELMEHHLNSESRQVEEEKSKIRALEKIRKTEKHQAHKMYLILTVLIVIATCAPLTFVFFVGFFCFLGVFLYKRNE